MAVHEHASIASADESIPAGEQDVLEYGVSQYIIALDLVLYI
jgi:hypothetical protein